MTVIVDYGCGNPASIRNMLKKLGFESAVSSNPQDVASAERLILPGVGAFDHGMKQLEALQLLPALNQRVIGDKVPVLGVCLGAQLLARKSEEGACAGLGWIEADVVRFDRSRMTSELKIPLMGWADVQYKDDARLFADYLDQPRFYFVHAFHLECLRQDDVIATARHGYEFPAAVARNNILGVQFHPEKSHRYGMTLLRNFMLNF